MPRRRRCVGCGSPQVGRYCGRCGARSTPATPAVSARRPGSVPVLGSLRRWSAPAVLAVAVTGALAWAGGGPGSDGVVLERPSTPAPTDPASPERRGPGPARPADPGPGTPTAPQPATPAPAPWSGAGSDRVRCLTDGCVLARVPLPGPTTTVVGIDAVGPAIIDADVLLALDAHDGDERWRAPISDLLAGAASPADLDGRAAVTVRSDGDGVVVASDRQAALLDVGTGERRWTFTSPSWGIADVAVTGDLVLLTGTTAGGRTPFPRLTALDRSDGSIRWERLTTALVRAGAARIVVRTSGEVLQGLDPGDGVAHWERAVPGAATTTSLGPWLSIVGPGEPATLELVDPVTGTTLATLDGLGSDRDPRTALLELGDGSAVLTLDPGGGADHLRVQALGPDAATRWSSRAAPGAALLGAGAEVVVLGPDGEARYRLADGRELPPGGAPRIAEVLASAGPLALARTPGASPDATGLALVDVEHASARVLTVRAELGTELEPVPNQPRWLRLPDQLLLLAPPEHRATAQGPQPGP